MSTESSTYNHFTFCTQAVGCCQSGISFNILVNCRLHILADIERAQDLEATELSHFWNSRLDMVSAQFREGVLAAHRAVFGILAAACQVDPLRAQISEELGRAWLQSAELARW